MSKNWQETNLLRACFNRVINGLPYHQLIDEQLKREFVQGMFSQNNDANLNNVLRNFGLNRRTAEIIYGTDLQSRKAEIIDDQSALAADLAKYGGIASAEFALKDGTKITLSGPDFIAWSLSQVAQATSARMSIYSRLGKQLEKALMRFYCQRLGVPESHYDDRRYVAKTHSDPEREYDFLLFSADGRRLKVEVKLITKHNANSSDQVLYRKPAFYLAWELSDSIKKELTEREIPFIELKGASEDVTLEKLRTLFLELNVPMLPELVKTAAEINIFPAVKDVKEKTPLL